MKRLSPSTAGAYDFCPKYFERSRILKEPEPAGHSVENEIRTRFGNAWHTLIRGWLVEGPYKAEAVRPVLIRRWPSVVNKAFGRYEYHALADELKKAAYPFITIFAKKMVELGLNRKPLLCEKQIRTDIGFGWYVAGRVDAVWQHGEPIKLNAGGITEITDWKSSRGVKSEETLRKDLQLRTYSWLACQHWDLERVQATLHYVMANKRIVVMFSRHELGDMLNYYEDLAHKIRAGLFPQVNDNRCSECSYTRIGKACEGSSEAMDFDAKVNAFMRRPG